MRSFERIRFPLVALAFFACPSDARAAWVEFEDQTDTRLVAAPAVGIGDVAEKSFAWGDLDRDGDVDLVVGRKQPFTTAGKRTNVLFLNEGGVLTDRTADYATASDIVGDQGFLTPTNDRDVRLVDVDLDGWLDVVTAPALGSGDPTHVGHPRVYLNRGAEAGGWLGLRHESGRIPALLSYSGAPGWNPNFTSVAAGDVDGDGYPDLYFTDHDTLGAPAGSDFNDKLLLNQGASNPGFFTDATGAFTGLVGGPGQPFPVSGFGTAAAIADMNGDGALDVVKQTGVGFAPFYTGIAYNDPAASGSFDTYDVPYTVNGYYVSVADLNEDDRLDLVVTDEGQDRYLLNQGNGADGLANFQTSSFSYSHDGSGGPSSDEGFGGDNVVADLDGDGWSDVLITDVTIDLPGCGRRMHLYRNLGGSPGDGVVLQEQTEGSGCQHFFGNPPTCIVAGIPSDRLEGVHDVAVFDVDGDGWNDLVLGRCAGLTVYVNQPPTPAGGLPDGDGIPGSPLLARLEPDGKVTLSWAPSCRLDDDDYAVYEGTLGDFTSHVPRICSTGGSTTATFEVPSDAYFLVVPRSADREGAYGDDGDGNPRPPSISACLPQLIATCD